MCPAIFETAIRILSHGNFAFQCGGAGGECFKRKKLKNSKEIYSGQQVEPSRVQSRWSPIGELALSLCHFHFD